MQDNYKIENRFRRGRIFPASFVISNQHFITIERKLCRITRILFLSNVAVGLLLTLIFSQMVAVEIVFHLRIFRFGAEQEKIEVTDSKEKVYLFDEKGQLHHWFSLPGDATSVS